MNKKPYDIKILDLKSYLKHQYKRYGLKHFFRLTDTNYPRVFARGYCSHLYKEIVILKGSEKPLLYHEIGHELGFNHTDDKKSVMYPNFKRGIKGISEITKEYIRVYGSVPAFTNLIKQLDKLRD